LLVGGGGSGFLKDDGKLDVIDDEDFVLARPSRHEREAEIGVEGERKHTPGG